MDAPACPEKKSAVFWVMACLVGVLLCSLEPSVALAGEVTDAAALSAHATREQHCPDVGALDVTKAAASVAQVATVWQQVSEAYETEDVGYILYWRGVLAQCLGYDEKAIADLSTFIRTDARHTEFVAMERDAQRRLRFLTRRASGETLSRASMVLGIGFLVGGGVLGGLTLSQGVQVATNTQAFESAPHDAAGRQALLEEREPLVIATNGLLAGTISCLAISAVSFALHAGSRRLTSKAGTASSRTMNSTALRLGIRPTIEGGLMVGLAGNW